MSEEIWTEGKIIRHLSRYTDIKRFPWQLANSFIYSWESDFWTMTQEGITREFEIKISRADYFKDSKKEKHTKGGGANYFYYVCPKDLIKKEEVQNPYGLIYVSFGQVEIIKKPKQRHNNRYDNWEKLANKMYWKYRELWKQKYVDKEIAHEEYKNGFTLQIDQEEVTAIPSQPLL